MPGKVRSMRADIVDHGIEHGTAKFIVNGKTVRVDACIKYDDYDRDEIGSHGGWLFRFTTREYICRRDREHSKGF